MQHHIEANTQISPLGSANGAPAMTLRETAAAYLELTKPGITRMVVLTTAVGFAIAAEGAIDVLLLLNALLGTALAASGSGALNQYVERRIDARMGRTMNRPLPSGKIRPKTALLFATMLGLAGIGYLAATVNLVTAAVVAASLVSYVWIYTPLKRVTSLCTLVGAVPGALPILAGWTAAGGDLAAPGGWALFWILFFWQIPHFLALAWMYRDDYGRAGLAMLSVDDRSGATGRQAVLYALALLPISLLPIVYGVLGSVYATGALALGLFQLWIGIRMLRHPELPHARRLFFASIAYLPLLLVFMMADRVVTSP